MDERTRRRLWDKGIGTIQKRIRNRVYTCLEEGCDRDAIASHSQQREAQLRSIARDGKVYALDRNLYSATKRDDGDGPTRLRLQGIGSASTFPGFCAAHDARLFRRLDQESGTELDREQAWALFLRTFAYEFSQKRKAYDVHTEFQKLCQDLRDPHNRRMSQIQQAGVNKMLTTDAPEYLKRLWAARDREGYPGLVHHQRLIEGNLGLSTSCMFSPLAGEARRQATLASFQPLVAFNIVPGAQRTLVIASVLDEHAQLAQWIGDDLADDTALEGLIHRCAFAESEDTCLRPQLWESLSDAARAGVCHAMEHEIHRGPLQGMPRIVAIPAN